MSFDFSTLKFDEDGLIPCITQDATTLEVLMLAWMNMDALQATLKSGSVTYWSRSRRELWVKGATSGNRQKLQHLRFDCDRDCLLVLVNQNGSACHTGKRSCFYTEIANNSTIEVLMEMEDERSV